MYYKIIELSPKELSVSYDETKDLIWHFLCALESNGQILKNYKVIQNINFMLYVTTPKENSLSEQYDSVYVRNDREKISEYFNIQIKECGIDLESQEYCTNLLPTSRYIFLAMIQFFSEPFVYTQSSTVNTTPNDEVQRCSVPQTSQKHCQKQVDIHAHFAFSISTEGNVKIISEP